MLMALAIRAWLLSDQSAKVIEIKTNMYLLSENFDNNPIITALSFTT